MEIHLKNKITAREVEDPRKQAEITDPNHGSNPDSIHNQGSVESNLAESNIAEAWVAEMEAAQSGMLEEWQAEVEDGKAATTHRSTAVGVDVDVGKDVEKPLNPEPENAVHSESINIDPTDSTSDPDHIEPYNNEYGSSEDESLISKLEAAKQRFDIEMALKGEWSGPASPELGDVGGAVAQRGDAKPQNLAPDHASLEATEAANRNLRMLLSSFAKPEAANNKLKSNVFHLAGDNGATSEHLREEKAETLKQDVPFYEAIELANQKLTIRS